MNGQKLATRSRKARVRARYYRCPTAPAPTPKPSYGPRFGPLDPMPLRKPGVGGWLLDFLPGILAVAIGVTAIAMGAGVI